MALNTSLETNRSSGVARNGQVERTGGPRGPHSSNTPANYQDRFGIGRNFGSHMPIDADPHWRWDNPLNILPAVIAVFLLLALLAIVIV